jgi:hypothetical protein
VTQLFAALSMSNVRGISERIEYQRIPENWDNFKCSILEDHVFRSASASTPMIFTFWQCACPWH